MGFLSKAKKQVKKVLNNSKKTQRTYMNDNTATSARKQNVKAQKNNSKNFTSRNPKPVIDAQKQAKKTGNTLLNDVKNANKKLQETIDKIKDRPKPTYEGGGTPTYSGGGGGGGGTPTSNGGANNLGGEAMGVTLDDLKKIQEQNTARSEAQAQKVMDFNAQEAQKNRDWQTEMSNTAHQREVNDLVSAGLNPVLSAGGGGANTGAGATASATSGGEVDKSMISAIVDLAGQAMQQNTAITAANIAAGATMGAANIHASSARYAASLGYKGQWVHAGGNVLGNMIGLLKYL